jgi:muramidase (phage lysozyme)
MASRKENQVIQNILAMIAKAEGTTKREGNPYDVVVGFGNFLKPGDNDPVRNTPTANKPVSQMTFKEVKEFGRALVNATKGKNKDGSFKIGDNSDGSSAVGKYQLLANYFNTDGDGIVGNLQKKLRARGVKGFKDTDIFNERAQDLLAIELLKENDGKLNGKKILDDYLKNPSKETMNKLMEKIASKWQGVPTAKPGRKNFQKREINYAQAVDMLELPESQYELAGADERGLATTKNKPPFRNIDDTERMLADEEDKRSLLVSSPQTSMRNVKSEEEEERENRIAQNQFRTERMDAVANKMRSLFKEKEIKNTLKNFKSAKQLMEVMGPTAGATVTQLDRLLTSKNLTEDVDKLPNRSVIKMFNYLKEGAKKLLNDIGIGEVKASEKFNIDQIKTLDQKFQEFIDKEGPGYDTSDIGVSGKPDTIFSEEAGSPDVIGDTSDVDAPLVSYGGNKVGTAPELQPTDIDNLEATQNMFEPEKLELIDAVSIDGRPNNLRPSAGANLVSNIASINQDLAEGDESDDMVSYALVDRFDDATEIGYGELNRLDRNLEPRERSEFDIGFDGEPMPMGGEADPKEDVAEAGIDPNDPIDFSFLKSLFTGGFGFGGRDSELEENIGADYFYDEPMPMGGEVDLRDESDDVIMNFEEGGEVKADFDGKEDVDVDEDEGDPPPLAKPEEVADDIPALLSEGEYVLPANVVRYLGVERIVDMHRQALSEIQQMEDIGMIQNVDENGQPENDDDEMKFAEGEEPEEGEKGVTKGTIIIASSKPKGMMCPEPIMMRGGGGMGSQDDAPGTGPTGEMGGTKGKGGQGMGPGGKAGIGDKGKGAAGPDYSQGFPSIEEEIPEEEENLDRTPGTFGGFTDLDEDFYTSPERGTGGIPDIAERAMYAVGKLAEKAGVDMSKEAAAAREAAEAEASQPGDMDFELEINEDNIKQDKVNDVVADLITKNVYIEGVGYVPLAGLMSPKDSLPV